MSDTPRTDVEIGRKYALGYSHPSCEQLCRQLERSLAAATARAERAEAEMEKWFTMSESYRDAMNRYRDEVEHQAQRAVKIEAERDAARAALCRGLDGYFFECCHAWRSCTKSTACREMRRAAGVPEPGEVSCNPLPEPGEVKP